MVHSGQPSCCWISCSTLRTVRSSPSATEYVPVTPIVGASTMMGGPSTRIALATPVMIAAWSTPTPL
jgi:hypothetical protein